MIYTWCCQNCKKLLEVERKLQDYEKPPEPGTCPDCGGELRRGMHPTPNVSEIKWKGNWKNHS